MHIAIGSYHCYKSNKSHRPTFKIVVPVLMLLFTVSAFARNYNCDSVLIELDNALSQRSFYYGKRIGELDSIKAVLSGQNVSVLEKLLDIERIGDEYTYLNNDSSIVYYMRGLTQSKSIGNDSLATVFQLKLAAHLPIAGLVSEGLRYFEAVDTTGMSNAVKYLYCDSGRKLYYFSMILSESNPSKVKYYQDKMEECQHHMIDYLDADSDMYIKALGEYYFIVGQNVKAWNLLTNLLEKIPPDTYCYSSVAETLGRIAEERHDVEAQKYYYALAAIAEIRAAVRDVSALQGLAKLLFTENDVTRSYQYMSVAMTNATDCRAVARIIQISHHLPIITETHNLLVDKWTRIYIIIISVLGLCIAVTVIVLYLYYRHNRIRKKIHAELERTSRIKDASLSQFMLMCSVYVDKLNQFNGLVKRKIDSGQTSELYQLVKSGKLVEEQTRDFYDIFDETVLLIFPNFVEDVNRLLVPESRISLKVGEKLNTDLRIIAFMRLGVDDTNHIAHILNYSVNTIYAYRNRIRSHAINRERRNL